MNMNSKTKAVHSGMLAAAAFIWGFAFVAQSSGGDAIGPYAFNWIRNLIAAGAVYLIVLFRDKIGKGKKPNAKSDKIRLWRTGILCGAALFVASTLQQVGITMGTSVGKAGFLTACYILIVPIVGIFLKKSCGWNVWAGAGIMLVGIYLLCMKESFSIAVCDLLILICSLCFTVQITLIDTMVKEQDAVRIAAIEFLTVGILGAPLAFIFDMNANYFGVMTWFGRLFTSEALISVLFAAIFSSAIAYTFQMVGQQGVNPTVASMLMSLESMFAVVGGWLILKEKLTSRELVGCAIMFAAIILAQISTQKNK